MWTLRLDSKLGVLLEEHLTMHFPITSLHLFALLVHFAGLLCNGLAVESDLSPLEAMNIAQLTATEHSQAN